MAELYALTNMVVDTLKMISFFGFSMYTLMQIGIYIGVAYFFIRLFFGGMIQGDE